MQCSSGGNVEAVRMRIWTSERLVSLLRYIDVLSLTDKCVPFEQPEKEGKLGLQLRNQNEELRLGCARQPTALLTALSRAHYHTDRKYSDNWMVRSENFAVLRFVG